jgi:hypothetical protein
VAGAAVAALLLSAERSDPQQAPAVRAGELAALPRAPAPSLVIGRPRRLAADRFGSRWTVVIAPTVARSRPNAASAVVTRLTTRTPEGTANVLSVVRSVADRSGRLWVEVRLPVLPNGTHGWVARRALGGYELLHSRLVVDRRALTIALYRNGKRIFEAPAGIGTAAWPTPPGEFTIKNKLTSYDSPFYGPIAFGTTARSAVLTEWPDGGFVGIHGTNEPGLIPGRVSHGCIRLRNADILRLARVLQVGTPLTID